MARPDFPVALAVVAGAVNRYRALVADVQLIVYAHWFLLAGLMSLLWLFEDRYLIWLLPGLILFLLKWQPLDRGRLAVAAIGSLLWWTVSVTGTLDHIHHQEALRTAYDRLLEMGVPPSQIDGGYTINGWMACARPGQFSVAPPQPPAGVPVDTNGPAMTSRWVFSKSQIPQFRYRGMVRPAYVFWASGNEVNLLQKFPVKRSGKKRRVARRRS